MTTPTGPETMRISLSVTDYSWPGRPTGSAAARGRRARRRRGRASTPSGSPTT